MKNILMPGVALATVGLLSGCGSGPDPDESRNFSTTSRATSCCGQTHTGQTWFFATCEAPDPTVGSLVYVLRTQPAEEAVLLCYRTTGRGDLELASARRISHDLKIWNFGGKGLTPEAIQRAIKRENDLKKEDTKKD